MTDSGAFDAALRRFDETTTRLQVQAFLIRAELAARREGEVEAAVARIQAEVAFRQLWRRIAGSPLREGRP